MLSGAKGGLHRVETVAVIVFNLKVWSFDLFGWFATTGLFWIWLI